MDADRAGTADIVAVTQVDLLAVSARGDTMPDTVVLFPTSVSAGADRPIAAADPDEASMSGSAST